MPGGMLSISAAGRSDSSGVIWASLPDGQNAIHDVVPGRLIAFAALPVDGKLAELWRSDKDSGRASARDRHDIASTCNFSKFAAPTVANGKVYLATFSNKLMVYGWR
jgi:hypothetical protein